MYDESTKSASWRAGGSLIGHGYGQFRARLEHLHGLLSFVAFQEQVMYLQHIDEDDTSPHKWKHFWLRAGDGCWVSFPALFSDRPKSKQLCFDLDCIVHRESYPLTCYVVFIQLNTRLHKVRFSSRQ